MYSFDSRVRYSEIGNNKKLDLASIINYFQDCSSFQSEDIGKGIDYFDKVHRSWLMNSWQIIVHRFPALCETITTSTWAYDFKSMYGYRNFMITDKDKQVCAIANSIWVLIDTETQKPLKVTEEDIRGYHQEEKYPMEYAPRKIKLPPDLTAFEAFPVVKSNIDTNRHVNNGQYIKMAEEYIPTGFKLKQMRAEYRMSAVLGDIIVPKVYSDNNICTVVLENTEQTPYAVIEFSTL